MRYHGRSVSLDNYREVFRGRSEDILDEIRSAILDGIPLHHYLDRYSDPWQLHQIRLAIKDTVPPKYYVLAGEPLRVIRQLHASNINLSPIDKYLTANLSEDVWMVILDCLEAGIPLEDYDFTLLPPSMIPSVVGGIASGVDMSRFVDGSHYTEQYIQDIITLESRFGLDVSRLIQEGYSAEVVAVLASQSHLDTCIRVYDVLKLTMKPDEVEVLADLFDVGFPDMAEVTRLDTEGYLVYMAFQLDLILEAFTSGLSYQLILDPNLGIGEINARLMENRLKLRSRFRGSIKKHRS